MRPLAGNANTDCMYARMCMHEWNQISGRMVSVVSYPLRTRKVIIMRHFHDVLVRHNTTLGALPIGVPGRPGFTNRVHMDTALMVP